MAVRFPGTINNYLRKTTVAWGTATTVIIRIKLSVDRNTFTALVETESNGDSVLQTDGDGTTISAWHDPAYDVSSESLTVGAWRTLAVVRNGSSSYKVYADNGSGGMTEIITSGSGGPQWNTLRIGTDRSNEHLNGVVAAMYAYNAALSQAEIEQQLHAQIPVRFADLIGWYPLFPGTGERILDYSGSGNHMTQTGTVTDEDGMPVNWGVRKPSGVFQPVAGGGTVSFSASIAAASVTPAAELAVLRSMTGNVVAGSASPSAVLAVARALTSSIAGQTATPDDLTLVLLVSFSAAIQAGTSTPAASLAVLRNLIGAGLAASATSAPALAVLRALTGSLPGQSATSSPVIAVLRTLQAALTGASVTPDDVDLRISGLVSFATSVLAASVSGSPSLAVLRAVAATPQANGVTPDVVVLAVLVAMQASVQAGSDSGAGVLGVVRALSAGCEGQSATGAATLAVLRALAASVQAGTLTPDDAELLVVLIAGAILITFSASQPGVGFSAKQPGAAFTASQPGVTFE